MVAPPERLQELFDPMLADIPECQRLVEEMCQLRDESGLSRVELKRNHPDIFASRGTITVSYWNYFSL